MKKRSLGYLNYMVSTSLVLLTSTCASCTYSGAALAIDADDDTGVFGSVGVARLARAANRALSNKDWPTAIANYKQAIEQKADFPGFYYGLLYSSLQNSDWTSAASAIDGISEKDAAARAHLNYEVGHVYSMNGRYDEAVPLLKTALVKASTDADFLSARVRDLQKATSKKAPKLKVGDIDPSTGKPIPQYVELKAPEVVKPELVPGSKLNPDDYDVGRDYSNAFRLSEWIGIVEYKGYEKKPGIGFFNPPTAVYSRIECLKGPPLAKRLPLHFKFYELSGDKMPAGWKWSEDKLPAKGSKWIIFIPNAMPTGDAFDTYKGSYGRQPATDENVGEIRRIIEAHKGQG